MNRYMFAIVVIALLAGICCAGGASAGDAGEIIGLWEGRDIEAGEFYSVEFGEDGLFYVEIYSVDDGYYIVDEANGQLGWEEEDLEDSQIEWADYVLDEDLLVVTMDDEELPFTRIATFKDPEHDLVGRWALIMEEFEGYQEPEESGEELPAAFIIDFHNDGSAETRELDDVVEGTFFVDAGAGVIELTMGDEEAETASYVVKDGVLILTSPDGETITLERLM
jgi:hypothetical protein